MVNQVNPWAIQDQATLNYLNSNQNVDPNLGIAPTSVARDLSNSLLGFPTVALHTLGSIPGGIYNVGKYALTHPPLSAKNFQTSTIGQGVIGAGETLADLANAPHALAQYLQSKGIGPYLGIPNTSSINANDIPSIPTQKIENYLGVSNPSPEAQSVRNVGGLALGGPLNKIESAAVRSGIVGATAAGAGVNPIQSMLGFRLAEKAPPVISALGQKISSMNAPGVDPAQLESANAAAQQALINQKSNLAVAKSALKARRSDLPARILTNQANIENFQNKIASMPAIEENPTLENIFNGQDQMSREYNAANMVADSQKDVSDAIENIQDILPQESNFQTPGTQTGGILSQVEQDERDAFKPRYNALNQRAATILADIPTSKNVDMNSEIIKNARDILGSKYLDDNPEIAEEITSGNAQIQGDKFVSFYKTAKNLFNVATMKSNDLTLPMQERELWAKKADTLKPIYDAYRSSLVKQFPQDFVSDLDTVNSDYAKKVAPVYSWSGYKSLNDHGVVPDNFLETIAGSMPHQELLQKWVKNNPDLLSSSLSQMYRDDPTKLLEYNGATEPFIQSHHELDDARQGLQLAQNNLDAAQNIHENVKRSSKRQQLIDKANQLQAENDNLTRQHNLFLQNQEKAMEDARNSFMDEHSKMQLLKQKAAETQKAIDDYNNKQAAYRNKLWNMSKGMATYSAHWLGFHELMKLFRKE